MRPDRETLRLIGGPVFDGAAPRFPLGRLELPERFSFTYKTSVRDAPVARITVVHDDGKWVCDEVIVRRTPGGRSCRGFDLENVPLRKAIRLATAQIAAALLSEESSGDSRGVIEFSALDEAAEEELWDVVRRGPRRRQQMTDPHLKEVADIYLQAGNAPIRAVKDHFGRPYSTAARWVKRAELAGYLDPAFRVKKGAAPAKGKPGPLAKDADLTTNPKLG